MDYPGWSVETTHPVDEADPAYCSHCFAMIDPTIAFAQSWGSTAHSATEYEPPDVAHTVTVRQV
jgi:hypothetical protein